MNKLKKVLIITYYWPPAGGPGVQRVLKFAKYLPQFGWEPVILTTKGGDYHSTDKSLKKEVNKSIKVYYTKKKISILDVYKFFLGKNKNIASFELSKKKKSIKYKFIKFIRANVYYPDARKYWRKPALKLGKKIIENEKPKLIFTTSPPHSLQLVGQKLSQKFNIKWIADFRDPWTNAFWEKDLPRLNWIHQKNSTLEKNIVNAADCLITINNSIATMLQKKQEKIFNIISNGYDHEDFKDTKNLHCNKFRIVYTGSISSTQIPINFVKTIGKLPEEIKKNISINFFGVFDPYLHYIINKKKLTNNIILNSYVSHDKAISIIKNAECLLLLVPSKNSKGILTAKIYEYMATKNFILTLAPKNHEIRSIIDEYGNGVVKSYEENVLEVIIRQYERWIKGEKGVANEEFINQFTRKKLTQKLSEVFDKTLKTLT